MIWDEPHKNAGPRTVSQDLLHPAGRLGSDADVLYVRAYATIHEKHKG